MQKKLATSKNVSQIYEKAGNYKMKRTRATSGFLSWESNSDHEIFV